MNSDDINFIAVTDCGSTTTKAILIEKVDGVFRRTARGDAPTTVEAPEQDVTAGVLAALDSIAAMRGRPLVDAARQIIRPSREGAGVDLYLSTSSAGGGLQMMVAGVVRRISAQAAERAALGAGAIVAEVIACDDERPLHEQMARLSEIRPDMLLLGGGIDGGASLQVVEMAELLAAADPRPRFGDRFRLPVIFAGNAAVAEQVKKALAATCEVHVVENLLRTVDEERLNPARERVHDLFLDHVMREAPGFGRLAQWADDAVMPTPSAVGELLRLESAAGGENILCVDIGGATTDLFSVVEGEFTRTVSANLGMSYSATNVLHEAGIPLITRWLPFDIDEIILIDLIMNKTVRPTTIPDSLPELAIEQALAREALALSLVQHLAFTAARELCDDRGFGKAGSERQGGGFAVRDLDLIIGSGGVISHAPHPAEAMAMLIDGFLPEGVTRIAKDSIFMMPHLGVLSRRMPEAARSVYERDCLEPLGTCVAPTGRLRPSKPCLTYSIDIPGRPTTHGTLLPGEMRLLPLAVGGRAEATLTPARGCDVGSGPGKPWSGSLSGGLVGIVLDGRGRPIPWPEELKARRDAVSRWGSALGKKMSEAVD